MSLNPKITHWQGKTVWLVGASSGIGAATASLLHRKGANVFISARKQGALDAFVQNHPSSVAIALSVEDPVALTQAAHQIVSTTGQLDMVVYCAGHYAAQSALAFDAAQMQSHMDINYMGAVHTLDAVLPLLRRQGKGHISLVASVAGYRGLPQALAYGPTKAALINLAEVLYMDLQSAKIGVSLVNPGFVETPLTAQNKFKMPALLTPKEAAEHMVHGWEAGRFEIHYPKRFTLMLKLLQMLPYFLYFPFTQKATS